ncbi:MAG TPA: ADP/ATP-dependent (S)-NAD(P)H-hydrate dehydratase [Thermomicrobiales bacterium]|jgi:NAD(P)H-hydrate epimerase|nr:ADP/ATP-dependent (S)-NAD(P)H-hydrate dehydratase [Thermomicrobiales bacterium]
MSVKHVTFTEKEARAVLPTRSEGAHKWGVGGVFFIAGAPQYVGAVAMSARSAGRSGAGIVTLAVPRQIMGTIQAIVPEATMLPLGETESSGGARRAIEAMRERAEKSKALVIGPGLGDDENVTSLLAAIFGRSKATTATSAPLGFGGRTTSSTSGGSGDTGGPALPDLPMVLDADALNWLAGQDDWLSLLQNRTAVLTPHPGEMSRLLGEPVDDLTKDPVATARKAARKANQVVVFKYGHTVVSDGTRALVAEHAPTSLATAGSGDVLAGSIGAFLAQGVPALEAAALAVHVGSRAAARRAERFGDLGVVASDLPDAIAEVLAELAKG